MKPHSLKLSPNSDLIICIKEYSISKKLYGFVSGVVGNLSSAAIQCPGNQEVNKFVGNLEIVSLNGYFNNDDLHLHLSFADEGCNVFGGHLEEGTIVKKGADIFLLSFDRKITNLSNESLLKKSDRVKIYILNDCPWSKRAIRLLNSLSIDFETIVIDSDIEFKKVNSLSSHNTFPQIFLDNVFFGGYDELSNQAEIDSLNSFK